MLTPTIREAKPRRELHFTSDVGRCVPGSQRFHSVACREIFGTRVLTALRAEIARSLRCVPKCNLQRACRDRAFRVPNLRADMRAGDLAEASPAFPLCVSAVRFETLAFCVACRRATKDGARKGGIDFGCGNRVDIHTRDL